jgi:hypothetical protein
MHGRSGPGSIRGVAARWVAGANPAGMLEGAVVSAAVLAVVGEHEASAHTVLLTAIGVLAIYWLTHAYADALTVGLQDGQRRLWRQLLSSAWEEAAVLVGGIPALVVFAAAAGFGETFSVAVDFALWFTVWLLATVGHLAGYQAGVTGWRLTGETLLAGFGGAVMVLLKTLLH